MSRLALDKSEASPPNAQQDLTSRSTAQRGDVAGRESWPIERAPEGPRTALTNVAMHCRVDPIPAPVAHDPGPATRPVGHRAAHVQDAVAAARTVRTESL